MGTLLTLQKAVGRVDEPILGLITYQVFSFFNYIFSINSLGSQRLRLSASYYESYPQRY